MATFNYTLLEALDTVVRVGGFQRAARTLHLTQSAVSQRIRILEDQVGVPLLSRSAPPLPTALGGHLLRHYKQVQAMELELREELFGESSGVVSKLRIGVNADSLATWFLDVLSEVLKDHRVLFELIVENEEHSYRLLQRGEVLGCVSSSPKSVLGCECVGIGSMHYRSAATKKFKKRYFPRGLRPEAIASAPAVLFNRKDEVHEKFLQRTLGLRGIEFPMHYVPTSEGFLETVRRGIAYGLVPALQAHADFISGKIVDLAPGQSFEVKLYWHFMRRETAMQKLLRKTIVDSAARILKQS